jgi:NTE family protein
MEDGLLTLLKANKIFTGLDEKTYQELLPKFTRFELARNEALFWQGDIPENIHIIAEGKLSANLTLANGESRFVGYIEVGETAGESGALTNEPRSLTIKAIKNSVIYKLSSKNFIELCHTQPAVMFATIHPVIERSRRLLRSLASEQADSQIVLIAANPQINIEHFAAKLTENAASHNSLTVFNDFINSEQGDLTQTREQVAVLEKKLANKIIYLIQTLDSPLSKYCLAKANKLYIIAHSQATPQIDGALLAKIHHFRPHLTKDPELIILHNDGVTMPAHSNKWLALTQFSLHHHLRISLTKDYQRLLRFIRGKAVGLVLSGGGTRGWAHLGVIKALREKKIPIDMIGGTSVGAIVAGCYAVQENYLDTKNRFQRLVNLSHHAISWRYLTWPIISLFSAKNFTEAQQAVFSNISIEDLWMPYFCVSCNLATNAEEVHRDGVLWQKTRASSSMPGLIPPMVIDGEMHLDGGLLNNLPIDVMRNFIGKKGQVIAVDLNNIIRDTQKYSFPPSLTLKQIILAKLDIRKYKFVFPRFVETFLRSIFISSLAKSKQNSVAANTMISFNLATYRLLHTNTKQAEKLITIGYETTIKQLLEDTTAMQPSKETY